MQDTKKINKKNNKDTGPPGSSLVTPDPKHTTSSVKHGGAV